jgi:localization factor PodJL
MKFGVPWNVKGVRPEARDSARQAARRSGMSVGEWLNHVIAEQTQDDDDDHVDTYNDFEDERLVERDQLNERLDRLDQRLDQILAKEPPAPAPMPAPPPVTTREVIFHADPRAFAPPLPYAPPAAPYGAPAAPYAAPAPAPQGQWASTLDQAVAEISARAHTLDAPLVPQQAYAPSYPPAYNPPYAPPPAQAYHPPYAPPAMPAPASMPQQPAAPAPHAQPQPQAQPAPTFAAPQPQAPAPHVPAQDISGLENQLRTITEMVEKLHQPKDNEEISTLRRELAEIGEKLNEAMPRRAIEALEHEMGKIADRLEESRQYGVDPAVLRNMEHGLIEMHEALRGLKPAESLAGFEDAIRNLSFKIEQMGPSSHDPAFLQQLEAAIAALRGIVSHVASNDQLAMLADEIRGLSAKVERVSGTAVTDGPDMSALEAKISALTEELRHTSVGGLPPRLESLLNTMSDRMEAQQLSSGEQFALGNLEDRIVALAGKLDASEARLNQLGAIERGMAELLVHIQEMRAGGGNGAPRTSEIKREIERNKDSIEAVHGTVDAVVDRLALLESDRTDHPAAPQPAPMRPRGPAAAQPTIHPQSELHAMPAHAAEPRIIPPSAPAPAARPVPASVTGPVRSAPPQARPRTPIDPTLPPDYPLEPGSSGQRERGGSAAERIAASEAALDEIGPSGTISTGSTNFIAAARRAAQAAGPASGPAKKPDHARPDHGPDKPAGKSFSQRVRSMLAGASVVLLVAGGLKLSMNLLEPSERVAEMPQATQAQIASTAQEPIAPAAPARAAAKDAFAPAPVTTFQQAELPAPTKAEPDPADVTASIGQQAELQTAVAPGEQRLVAPEKFPAALRNAASSGDPHAAYEVAMRYLEGRGVSPSLEEAARWLEQGAKAGLAPAQFRLGSLYEKGQGVKKSLETAQRLYLSAAQKGNAKAMHNLAVLYAEGSQGKPDYKTASQWFRKAADRGVADSQYNLGILYARGIGVEQNLPEAFKWFSLAGAQGDREALKKRDDVGAKLDAQSIAAARLAAQNFVPERTPDEANTVKAPDGGWDRVQSGAPKPAKKPRAIEPLRITPS